MPAEQPKASRFLEVERKFAVVEATVSPSFEGLTSVARVERSLSQHLSAVYFDTPAQDLAAHRITLRRRTGGTAPGWHLKLPAGPDARTEVRLPLGDAEDPGAVPEPLRDVVAAIVRDRPLAPVARIETHRTVHSLYGADGALLAEFCDDRVTACRLDDAEAEPLDWREWELELAVGGDRGLLDRLTNRLLDAGAVPAEHGSKLGRVLQVPPRRPVPPDADPVRRAVAEAIEALLVWDRAVRADAPDAVHQMRVTTRRLRSLLTAAAPAFGLDDDAPVLDELRQLAAVLGEARDAEVLAERYRDALAALPAELVRGPVSERLVDGARRRYRTGHRRVLAALRSPRYFRLLDTLEELAAADLAAAAEPIGDGDARAGLRAAHKQVRRAAKAARKAAGTERDEALHRIRKAAKRLRYTAAATGHDTLAERARQVQTLLGEHQDSVVSRAHLLRAAAAAHAAGEDTFTYGVLHQREAELARRCRERLDEALARLDKAARKLR